MTVPEPAVGPNGTTDTTTLRERLLSRETLVRQLFSDTTVLARVGLMARGRRQLDRT